MKEVLTISIVLGFTIGIKTFLSAKRRWQLKKCWQHDPFKVILRFLINLTKRLIDPRVAKIDKFSKILF